MVYSKVASIVCDVISFLYELLFYLIVFFHNVSRNNFVYLKSLLDLTYLLSILLLDHWPMLYYVPAFGMLEVCPFELSCHFIFSTRAIDPAGATASGQAEGNYHVQVLFRLSNRDWVICALSSQPS